MISKEQIPAILASPTNVRIKCADNKHALAHSEVIAKVSKKFGKFYSKAMTDKDNSFDGTCHYPLVATGTPFYQVFISLGVLYFGKAFVIITDGSTVDEQLNELNDFLRFLFIPSRYKVVKVKTVPLGHKELNQFRELKLRCSNGGRTSHEKSLYDCAIEAACSNNYLSIESLPRANGLPQLDLEARNENCFCEYPDCKKQLFSLKEITNHVKTEHVDVD